jgi:hypothetical protein
VRLHYWISASLNRLWLLPGRALGTTKLTLALTRKPLGVGGRRTLGLSRSVLGAAVTRLGVAGTKPRRG